MYTYVSVNRQHSNSSACRTTSYYCCSGFRNRFPEHNRCFPGFQPLLLLYPRHEGVVRAPFALFRPFPSMIWHERVIASRHANAQAQATTGLYPQIVPPPRRAFIFQKFKSARFHRVFNVHKREENGQEPPACFCPYTPTPQPTCFPA